MEKQRICKICNRRFANGKAMGGHMRSHLAKLPVPSKPVNKPSPLFALISPSSSSSLSIRSSKDHMQTYRPVKREHSDLIANDDGESEAESSKNPTRRRSKRRRQAVVEVISPPAPQFEPESVSSVTENFPDGEVAMCLLMLSRDKWPVEDKKVKHEYIRDDESDSEEDDELFCVTRPAHKALTRNKYKCKTCRKVFRSYQALGGHKASHKNIKIHVKGLEEGSTADHDVNLLHQRIFKCPFCDKVFESGQALGGHKKIHFAHLTVGKNSAKSGENLIDLNLPAPEDDSELSQV